MPGLTDEQQKLYVALAEQVISERVALQETNPYPEGPIQNKTVHTPSGKGEYNPNLSFSITPPTGSRPATIRSENFQTSFGWVFFWGVLDGNSPLPANVTLAGYMPPMQAAPGSGNDPIYNLKLIFTPLLDSLDLDSNRGTGHFQGPGNGYNYGTVTGQGALYRAV